MFIVHNFETHFTGRLCIENYDGLINKAVELKHLMLFTKQYLWKSSRPLDTLYSFIVVYNWYEYFEGYLSFYRFLRLLYDVVSCNLEQ